MRIFLRTIEKVPCTVEVSHKFESLHAHVKFNNGAVVHPGDEVLVSGVPDRPECLPVCGAFPSSENCALVGLHPQIRPAQSSHARALVVGRCAWSAAAPEGAGGAVTIDLSEPRRQRTARHSLVSRRAG